MDRHRNWITPFPVDGVQSLLRVGAAREEDPYESNWCALQLILLLMKENASPMEINAVVKGWHRGSDGNLLVRPRDRGLQARVETLLASFNSVAVPQYKQ
jgi:hypothetical protein